MTREARGVVMGAGLAASLVMILAWPGMARRAADWLARTGPPVEADLLVMVTGGARERLQTLERLYEEGFGRAILVTGPPGAPEEAMALLVARGIPASVMVPPLGPSSSTREDAERIREIVVRHGYASILVVTSPYHCRRLQLMLERTLGDLGVQARVTPSVSLYLDQARWWTDRQGWGLIPAEYLKLAWAWVTVPGRSRDQKVTGSP